MLHYKFEEKLWKYQGSGAWYFITIPREYAEEIHSLRDPIKRGFGSIRVHVAINNSRWDTSIFPDKKSSSYLLPVKKDIRNQEGLQNGSLVQLTISILETEG